MNNFSVLSTLYLNFLYTQNMDYLKFITYNFICFTIFVISIFFIAYKLREDQNSQVQNHQVITLKNSKIDVIESSSIPMIKTVQNFKKDERCYPDCTGRIHNKLVYKVPYPAGSLDRFYVMAHLLNVANYFCADLYFYNPRKMLHTKHAAGKTVSDKLKWSDFKNITRWDGGRILFDFPGEYEYQTEADKIYGNIWIWKDLETHFLKNKTFDWIITEEDWNWFSEHKDIFPNRVYKKLRNENYEPAEKAYPLLESKVRTGNKFECEYPMPFSNKIIKLGNDILIENGINSLRFIVLHIRRGDSKKNV